MTEIGKNHPNSPTKNDYYENGSNKSYINHSNVHHMNSYNRRSINFPLDEADFNSTNMVDKFEDLVETEVFAGEEDYFEDTAKNGGVMPSSLIISYYKDGFPHLLNSVKEDVEAEEAEEKLENYHSLDYLGLSIGQSSLSSSVVSSVSLDGVHNPLTHNQDIQTISGKEQSTSYSQCHKLSKSNVKKTGSGIKNSPLCKSWHTELSHTNESSLFSPSSILPNNYLIKISPNLSSRVEIGEKQLKYNMTPLKDKNKLIVEKRIWHNPSRSDYFSNTKCDTILASKKSLCRSKSEAREVNSSNINKFNSLPRKTREKCDQDNAADKYGSLGRNHVRKEVNGTTPINESTQNSYCRVYGENKNILDKYATLPRKKARDMGKKWRDSLKETESPILHNSRQRSRSVGKSESLSFRTNSNSSTSSINSSKSSSSTTRQGQDKCTKFKHRSNKLASKDISNGPRVEKTPIIKHKIRRTLKKHSEVQVNMKWDHDESELVEKLRNLVDENLSLQTRLQTAEANAEEVEMLRMEGDKLRRQADDERMEKEELQDELTKTSAKVMEMLSSMEGVEKEFTSRGESLLELGNQLQISSEFNMKMQENLNLFQEYNIKLEKDLEKSLAAQKILLQQVQDSEAEGREMVEFVAEEKNALAECLKESELELCRQREKIKELEKKLMLKDEEARHMVRLAEERRMSCHSLQSELDSMKSRANESVLDRETDLSYASSSLTALISKLKNINLFFMEEFSISELDIENVVVTGDIVNASTNLSKLERGKRSSINSLRKSPSPKKPVCFAHSFLDAIRMLQKNAQFISNDDRLKSRINDESIHETEYRPSNTEGTICSSTDLINSTVSQSGSCTQVMELDSLLTRMLRICCVLKSDADILLFELEGENELLYNQLQMQQKVIDQQSTEFENLITYEYTACNDLKLIAYDLESANDSLGKAGNEEARIQAMGVDDVVKTLKSKLDQMDAMLKEKRKKIAQEHRLLPEILNPVRLYLNTNGETPSLLSQSLLKSVNKFSVEQKIQAIKCKTTKENGAEEDLDHLVNVVLTTLESVPDIVSNCSPLKNLYVHLACGDGTGSPVNREGIGSSDIDSPLSPVATSKVNFDRDNLKPISNGKRDLDKHRNGHMSVTDSPIPSSYKLLMSNTNSYSRINTSKLHTRNSLDAPLDSSTISSSVKVKPCNESQVHKPDVKYVKCTATSL